MTIKFGHYSIILWCMAWRKLFGAVVTWKRDISFSLRLVSQMFLGENDSWKLSEEQESAEETQEVRNSFQRPRIGEDYSCQRLSQNIHQGIPLFWVYSITPIESFLVSSSAVSVMAHSLSTDNSNWRNTFPSQMHPLVTRFKPKSLVMWANDSQYGPSFSSSGPLRIATNRVTDKHAPHFPWPYSSTKQVTACP